MHIAFISSMRKPTTLTTPGGAEVWSAEFLIEAIKRGHTFDLYAIKGSLAVPEKINLCEVIDQGADTARLQPFIAQSEQPQRELDVFTAQAYIKILLEIKDKESTYDLVIDSATAPHFGISWNNFTKPLLVIGHSPAASRNISSYLFYKRPTNVSFVFPSLLQKEQATWLPSETKSVISHGINIIDLPFLPNSHKDHMLFLGRFDIDQPKGMEEAIQVAQKLDRPLDIYTYIEPNSLDYFTKQVLPSIEENPTIHYTQSPQPSKKEIFANAKVLLFAPLYDEPFGLVLLESMATGTPIIGFARGALPDIIKDGKTGFLVNPSSNDIRGDFVTKKAGMEGLFEAVERIFAMPEEEYKEMRKKAREQVEQHFTIQKMVDQYEDLFKKILQK